MLFALLNLRGSSCRLFCIFFFFNDTATTEIYTLSLHDALPIKAAGGRVPVLFMARRAWIHLLPRQRSDVTDQSRGGHRDSAVPRVAAAPRRGHWQSTDTVPIALAPGTRRPGMSEDGGAFGSHLRSAGRAAGLSQQELAERAGLSVRTIGNMERGASKWPYRDSLHRLADALSLRDEARAEFIAAAGRRLAPDAVPDGTRPGGAWQAGRARVVAAYLPATLPAFVGRRDQLATLSQVLQHPRGTPLIPALR